MSIPIREFSVLLETQNYNNTLNQELIQGSADTALLATITQDGKSCTISDTAKLELTILYNSDKTKTYYIESTDSNFPISIETDGTLKINFNEMMTTVFGTHEMYIRIEDTTVSYMLKLSYNVLENKAYDPQSTPNNLPSYEYLVKQMDLKLNKNYSNSNDTELEKKVRSFGIGTSETAEQIRDKLQTLKNAARLDNTAIKNSLSNDLADVDLQKLDEKFQATDSGKILKANSQAISTKADTNLDNVPVTTLSEEIKLTNAYKDIASRTSGLTPDEIKALFKSNYFEETTSVDLTQAPFTATTLLMGYQFTSNDETITQTLPPITQNKTIMIKVLPSKGITNPTLVLQATQGEQINGTALPLTIKNLGYVGYLLPIANTNSWEYFPHETTHDFSLAISDDKSNVILGQNSVKFNHATVNEVGGIVEITPDVTTSQTIKFIDDNKREFTADKVQSLDKTIRISNLGGIADFARGLPEHNEGIHVCLGNDQLINSKYGRSKLYFSDVRIKGGEFVYANMQNKSFVVQDVDPQDDPNISGGTTFFVGLYFEPAQHNNQGLSQDGTIRLELVDNNDNVLMDINNNPMAVEIEYKKGDIIKPELYLGELQATAYKEVHLKIETIFAKEEIISVGANTQLCLQSITKNESSGLALLSFMAFTGYKIGFDVKYYGYNSLNLAQSLIFDEPLTLISNAGFEFGDNVYFNMATKGQMGINNYHLNIQDNGTDLPIWDVVKYYNEYDARNMSGKSYKITTTLKNPDNAMDISLMEYTGTEPIAPIPHVLRFNNENPVFTDGWSVVDNLFIAENINNQDNTYTKTFTIPVSAKALAIMAYPHEAQQPSNFSIKDIEGDITPWFNRIMITDNSHISEAYLQNLEYVYKSVIALPSGMSAYRYTVNNTETQIPIGVFSGNGGKIINDNSWHDAGSYDPNKTQGNAKFLADGTVQIQYQLACFNDTATVNNIDVYWVKYNADGTTTKITDSEYSTIIEAHRTINPKYAGRTFNLDIKNGESYGIIAKSNIADGFYLQTNVIAEPLCVVNYRLDVISDSIQKEIDRTFDKTNEIKFVKSDGTEITNKILVYDVDSGKFKLEDKV